MFAQLKLHLKRMKNALFRGRILELSRSSSAFTMRYILLLQVAGACFIQLAYYSETPANTSTGSKRHRAARRMATAGNERRAVYVQQYLNKIGCIAHEKIYLGKRAGHSHQVDQIIVELAPS